MTWLAGMTCLACSAGVYPGYQPFPVKKTLPCDACGDVRPASMTSGVFRALVAARDAARDAARCPPPWADCKVAFSFAADDDRVWNADKAGTLNLPAGWQLVETDGAGAHLVVVFRVEGAPTVEAGQCVAAILTKMEAQERAAKRARDRRAVKKTAGSALTL